MKKQNKKKGSQDVSLKVIIMATAILNLIKALIELINKILE